MNDISLRARYLTSFDVVLTGISLKKEGFYWTRYRYPSYDSSYFSMEELSRMLYTSYKPNSIEELLSHPSKWIRELGIERMKEQE